MRLLAPVSHPEEVEMLAENGANELFCGVIPQEWIDRYGLAMSINRRDSGPGNMEKLDELRELVELAHGFGVEVQLTLNAPSYTEDQLPFVFRLVAEAVEVIGVDAFIVADVGLLSALMDWRADLQIHVSSLAATHNSQAVRFFGELGASRVILPRQTRVEEALAMVAAVPEVEIEVFVLNDGCIYEEGYCSTVHAAGPICLTRWRYRFEPLGEVSELPASEREAFQTNLQDYRRWKDCHVSPGAMLTRTGMPTGPCGLCAIPELYHGGVTAVKLVGREGSAYKKLRSVQQVRHLLDRVANGLPAEETRAVAQAMRGTPELCRSGYGCYYPEVGQLAQGEQSPQSSASREETSLRRRRATSARGKG